MKRAAAAEPPVRGARRRSPAVSGRQRGVPPGVGGGSGVSTCLSRSPWSGVCGGRGGQRCRQESAGTGCLLLGFFGCGGTAAGCCAGSGGLQRVLGVLTDEKTLLEVGFPLKR